MRHGARSFVVKTLATLASLGASVITLTRDGDVELVAFMAAGVVAALARFHRSLDHRTRDFWPWLMLSVSVLAKAVPSIVFERAAEGSLSFERYDRMGSILAGSFIAIAMLLLAVPARDAARRSGVWVVVMIVGLSGVVSGAAGATLAFVPEPGFLGESAARGLETVGWILVGLILSGAAISISVATTLSFRHVGLSAVGGAVAVLLALTSSGRDIDLGWWVAMWAGLTFSSVLPGGSLGQISERDRPTSRIRAVAIIAALIAAGAIWWAELDTTTWEQGWLVLGGAGLILAVLAYLAPNSEPERAAMPELTPATYAASATIPADWAAAATESDPDSPQAAAKESDPDSPQAAAKESDPDSPQAAAKESDPDSPQAAAKASDPDSPAAIQITPAPVPKRAAGDPDLTSLVVDSVQPHEVDPSTTLLSASGLHEVLGRMFKRPGRKPGEIGLLMIALRNADEIEAEHGRTVGAEVTQRLADRLRRAVPDAACARHLRAGFAAVLEDQESSSTDTVDLFTQTLLALLEDVELQGRAVGIDVVAGMAQSYPDEDVASFVARANRGLGHAVQSPEPSLISMP